MSLETDIRDLLAADSTLTTTLTGGMYAFTSLGRAGFAKTSDRVSAWFANASGRVVLHPSLIVKHRSSVPTGERWDTKSQTQSERATVEMWLYDIADYDTLLTASHRIYQLLHGQSFDRIGYVARVNKIRGQRDQNLNDAALIRDDYRIKQIISGA